MYDVIVVGAGPAGTAAAMIIANAGCNVLLLDKAQFPRDKPCGDVVSTEALKELEKLGIYQTIDAKAFRPILGIEYFAPSGNSMLIDLHNTEKPRNLVARRTIFDALLKDHAEHLGAKFECAKVVGPIVENSRVQGVIVEGTGISKELRARYVVAADGSNSTLLRKMPGTKRLSKQVAVAIRAYITSTVELDHTLRAYFMRSLLPGYAWAFPAEPTVLNVGIGTTLQQYRRIGRQINELLHEFLHSSHMSQYVDKNSKIQDVQGWTLSMYSDDSSRIISGMIFVGDAGAFINPATGAGIATALLTGRLAGETLLQALNEQSRNDAILLEFDRRCQFGLSSSLRRATTVQSLLMHNSSVIDWFIRLSRTHHTIARRVSRWLEKAL